MEDGDISRPITSGEVLTVIWPLENDFKIANTIVYELHIPVAHHSAGAKNSFEGAVIPGF